MGPETKTIKIPVSINRASLGDGDIKFVKLGSGVVERGPRVAWVPRETVEVLSQPLGKNKLEAQVTTKIVLEDRRTMVVEIESDSEPTSLIINRKALKGALEKQERI